MAKKKPSCLLCNAVWHKKSRAFDKNKKNQEGGGVACALCALCTKDTRQVPETTEKNENSVFFLLPSGSLNHCVCLTEARVKLSLIGKCR